MSHMVRSVSGGYGRRRTTTSARPTSARRGRDYDAQWRRRAQRGIWLWLFSSSNASQAASRRVARMSFGGSGLVAERRR